MQVNEAILKRRSVRAYKDQPVEQELIEKIFTEAQQSPSNCNTQPWHVVVVSGKSRDAIEKAMMKEVLSGKAPNPHFTPGDHDLKDIYRKRQIDCAIALYGAMDIKKEDKEERQELMARNWQFFGAPHAAFFSMRKDMSEVNAVDMGIYLQTLMLLMTQYGIASCPQGALALFTDPVWEMANIPEENAIMCGLSFGYEDADEPINNYDVGRTELSNSVEFYS